MHLSAPRPAAQATAALWLATSLFPAAPVDAQSEQESSSQELTMFERLKERRNRPRRYSAQVKLHVTDMSASEQPQQEEGLSSKVEVPNYPGARSIPRFNPMTDMDPRYPDLPMRSTEGEETPRNWILPDVPDVEPMEEIDDPLSSPWEYLQMQLESNEEEYLDQLFPNRSAEASLLYDSSEIERRSENPPMRDHLREVSRNLLYSEETYEELLTQEPPEEASENESDSGYEPDGYEPVISRTVLGDEEDERAALDSLLYSAESADVTGEEEEWAEYEEEEDLRALRVEDAGEYRQDVGTLGRDEEEDEGGFVLLSRVLSGIAIREQPTDAETDPDAGYVADDSWRQTFGILSRTLQSSMTPAVPPEPVSTGPRSFLAVSTEESGDNAAFSAAPDRDGARTGLSAFPRTADPWQSSWNGARQRPLSSAIGAPAALGFSGPGPTADLNANPRRKQDRFQAIDVENLDILMH